MENWVELNSVTDLIWIWYFSMQQRKETQRDGTISRQQTASSSHALDKELFIP
jgi:hypothetical protein